MSWVNFRDCTSERPLFDYSNNTNIVAPMSFIDAFNILEGHSDVLRTYPSPKSGSHENFRFCLNKSLNAFKMVKVRGNQNTELVAAIANIIIPPGAIVHVGKQDIFSDSSGYKCRSDQAYVHSIFEMSSPHNERHYAQSGYDQQFPYSIGRIVTPKQGFDTSLGVCASGIHFFLDVPTCLHYAGRLKYRSANVVSFIESEEFRGASESQWWIR